MSKGLNLAVALCRLLHDVANCLVTRTLASMSIVNTQNVNQENVTIQFITQTPESD
jgi:hypothetical protein